MLGRKKKEEFQKVELPDESLESDFEDEEVPEPEEDEEEQPREEVPSTKKPIEEKADKPKINLAGVLQAHENRLGNTEARVTQLEAYLFRITK